MATDPTGRVSHLPEMHRGVSWKQPCRVATTANITISTALNNGDTIDGVTLATGDRVLVKNQTSGAENGIYVVAASPTRDYDMDQDASSSVPASEVLGAFIYVIAGTANGGKVFRATNTTAPTLGTTSLTFTEFAPASSGLSDPLTTRGDIITRGASATQRLALGASGYVLTSDGTDAVWAAAAGGGSFVGASAYHSTTQSISGSTITQANLDSEDFDTSAFHDNATNNTRMTAPSSGYYLVRAHANFAAGTATIVGLKKNGSMVRGSAVLGASGAALNTVKIVSLSTSDYIEMWVYATAGTTIGDATNIENQTSLDIQFLGA